MLQALSFQRFFGRNHFGGVKKDAKEKSLQFDDNN
jgi:hypothetical protein